MKAITALCFGMALTGLVQAADEVQCNKLADPAARLACFDAGTKPEKSAPKTEFSAPDSADQINAAKEAVSRKMLDPSSAQFRDLKVGKSGYGVCGYVNSKNRYGGYVGFNVFHYSRMSLGGGKMHESVMTAGDDPKIRAESTKIIKDLCASDGITLD